MSVKIKKKKLSLEKDTREELKVYFTIVRPSSVSISNEFVQATLAYNLESGLIYAKKNTPKGFSIVYHGQVITVKDFLDRIRTKQELLLSKKEKQINIKVKSQKLGIKQFKANLMYSLNEKVISKKLAKRDLDDLKRIIKKI